MTKEGVFEPGDEIVIGKKKVLKAVLADTDGSGCYVCDDGRNKCYFLNSTKPCPKCHSSEFGFIDYCGPRVIFISKNNIKK